MTTQSSYLNAIQIIPGDTAGEKYRWIAKFIKEQLSVSNKLEDVVESEKIPKLLVPLIQVQAAVMLNKKDHKNQSAYGAIAEALKSEDELVVNQALKASNFFNGTNKAITNTQYFFENLFPHVSFKTRTRIIKSLSFHLASKNPDLAAEFFSAIASFYGLEQALPLLLACSESFTYNTIIDKKIVLSRKMVKAIFRKNPDLVVCYLRLSKPSANSVRNLHRVNICDFSDFLAILVKKRIKSFVEIYEMHEKLPPTVNLSNKCTEAFLKNGRTYLLKNPKLFLRILPLKKISNKCMETIFPKLFPNDIKDFNTDTMLKYLEHYEQDKKVLFFLRSYKEAYNEDILEDTKKITAKLMQILPHEERIHQALIKLDIESRMYKESNHLLYWKCYLPTQESLPEMREEISRTTDIDRRAHIACKMIYCCRINNDTQGLWRALSYLKSRHSNEQPWFLFEVFKALMKNYDLPRMDEDCWKVLMDIIVCAYVKKNLLETNNITMKILEAAIHHKILQKEPIDQLIDILVDLKCRRRLGYWNILQKHEKYERMCLEACINIVSQKYYSDETSWKREKSGILFDICLSIYYFNENHVNKASRVECMTLKKYTWLLQVIEEMLSTSRQEISFSTIEKLQHFVLMYEKDLYKRFWPNSKVLAKVETGEALKLLKRKPQDILDYWEEYLRACKNNWRRRHTKSFVKAIRWYKEIPTKFAEQCFRDLTEKKDETCLDILSILVCGETYSKIIQPLIPTSKTLDIHHKDARTSYNMIQHIMSGIKDANPPVSLKVLKRLCRRDYFPVALTALTSVCRRTNIMDVISFARTLSSQRVSVRKHGIRLMHMMAPRDQLIHFLQSQCKSEQNRSIREVLFSVIIRLFKNEPGPSTWALLFYLTATLTLIDEEVFSKLLLMINSMPNQYVAEFAKQILCTIDKFDRAGLKKEKIAKYTSILLDQMSTAICNLLPEDFIKELIRRFLLHEDDDVCKSSSTFVLTALLLSAEDKFDDRMKLFHGVFKQIIETGWNLPHPDNLRFYPVNNALRKFVGFATSMVSSSIIDFQLIDGIFAAFLSVLNPKMDPTSYLLLVYSREQVSSRTPTEFGVRLAQRMNSLTEIFSPFFVFFMTDILLSMPISNSFKEHDNNDIHLGIIEGLLETESTMAALMSVKLLSLTSPHEQVERRDTLIIKLTRYRLTAVRAFISDVINRITLGP